ncbi:MAG: response regulator transcription factor [Candidatus Omnitrophota bacterium]|nr:response regulator transcription factor [Candidatus Omnitrophota bacterium]
MAKEIILLIEDEKNIVELVKYNLEQQGYRVNTAVNGNEGVRKAQKEKPDLVILDLMLPELDGIEVCKILRHNDKTASIPIIMLTARSEEADKIVGLELGADDYVTKPFSPRELVARVKAVLRRIGGDGGTKVLKSGGLEVDIEKHIVTVKGKRVDLTSKEFELLKCLLDVKGRVLSRDQLLTKVWGYEPSLELETRTVDMHIGQLRKKIKSESEKIITVKNVGYRFAIEE